LASHLSLGICRVKWISAAAIPLWLIGWRYQQELALDGYAAMGAVMFPQDPVAGAKVLVGATFALGIVSCLYLILTPARQISIPRARQILVRATTGALLCEGLQVGLTFGQHQLHYTSYSLALLMILSLVPLSLRALVALLAAAMLIPMLVAFNFYPQAGPAFYTSYVAHSTTPLAFGVFGILINQWHWRDFKAKRLVDLRLARRTRQLEQQKRIIEAQQAESVRQKLEAERRGQQLLNALSSALTRPVAEEYQQFGRFTPTMRTVCVIACDAVGFSETCTKLQPGRIVDELRKFFTRFDAACLKVQVEPLRAQGDSRIALAGLWNDDPGLIHQSVINAVLAMVDFRQALPCLGEAPQEPCAGVSKVLWPARIGITLGSAFIGVINTTAEEAGAVDHAGEGQATAHEGRLWFDVWGDAVNVAARLEQNAPPNGILVRESVLWETRGLFDHGPIHAIQVKNTIIPDSAEIYGISAPYRDAQGKPNDAFWRVYHARDLSPARPNPRGTLSVAEDSGEAVRHSAHATDTLNS
jgi:class 3 adenylate cyclase